MVATDSADILADFHPVVAAWFRATFGTPSPPQRLGWPSIASGRNTLILAPTGSGKTLAAFLWAINHLVEQHLQEELAPGVRIVYVSPLKALNNDIARNLAGPLAGIRAEAEMARISLPHIHTGVRTGDTSAAQRRAMITRPPDILITTPESLYLMLTGQKARTIFTTVQYVIVDEIHAVCGNKRGVHLSLSLERLQEIADQEFVRIGLSATQKPLERIAGFLGGVSRKDGRPDEPPIPRHVAIVDAGGKKQMNLQVVCPAEDFSLLPQDSVWPLVFDEMLAAIRKHRTTLVFVNNRRLAERVAAKLNELIADAPAPTFQLYTVPTRTDWSIPEGGTAPGESATDTGEPAWDGPLVQAYHGSMSRDAREDMETDLKEGRLKVLVATSALELGIDIGSVDLVIQLQSPKGIARGLQRVGRSGHLVDAASKGRLIATHREDLVESLVVARAMHDHDVEETIIPENCLDVLAQQITAMASVEPWPLDRLFSVVRRSYCYRNLSQSLFDRVIEMLAGRYSHPAFRDLRARISLDRVHRTIHALPGTSHTAITGGGTIADRGYFGVYLEDGRTKVGEVDEEFVYESRTGDTFLLGSNVWRMVGIDANRITVTPAPGQPARMPFWRGEGIGRSYELGQRIGDFRRELEEKLPGGEALRWLQQEFPVDHNGAWNTLEYFRRQHESTGRIPTDRCLLLEAFRDEVGDPRLILHSCYGRRVNGLLGLLCARLVAERTGMEPQMLYNDNGVMLRCNDAEEIPLDIFDGLDPEAARQTLLDDILQTPVYGGQFRQNAGRALLLPRTMPGKRTPLWLQRLRAADLLQVVRSFEDFPIVIETLREVLNDVLDLPHAVEILQGIARGSIRVETVQTEIPSPFAASLLFDFIAVYMYEWDQPRADRLSQFLPVNRDLLAEVVDITTISSLLKADAIDTVEQSLQHTAHGYRARTPEELMELLIRIGDLSEEEIAERVTGDAPAMTQELERTSRAVRVTVGGTQRWIAGEDRDVYGRLPAEPAVDRVLRRFVEHHGPVTARELADRYALRTDDVLSMTNHWKDDPHMAAGRFRPPEIPGSDQPQWCFRPTLERIHRQTITILRKEIQPCSLPEFTSFLLTWHHVDGTGTGRHPVDRETVLDQLTGLVLPAEVWQREIFPRRSGNGRTESSGQWDIPSSWVWCGSGPGRIRCFRRGEGGVYLGEEEQTELSEPARRVMDYVRQYGASFLADIRASTRLSLSALNGALAELFWTGLVTNDSAPELFRLKRALRPGSDVPLEPVTVIGPRSRRRFSPAVAAARKAIKAVPGWEGRWSLLRHPGVMGEERPVEECAALQVDTLLRRYGILAREFVRREELLPWSILSAELQMRELRGEVRRGYFVQGLSGMQYALPEAVERLRHHRSAGPLPGEVVLINASDPANPFGPGTEMPFGTSRSSRSASSYLAIAGGELVLLAELHGSRLWSSPAAPAAVLKEALQRLIELTRLPETLRPFQRIDVEACNGTKPMLDPLASILQEAGFVRGAAQTLRYEGYA